MRCGRFLTSLFLIGLACGGHAEVSEVESDQEAVHIGADGAIHRSSPLMRKHSQEEEEEGTKKHHHDHRHHQARTTTPRTSIGRKHHQHHHAKDETKALFRAMDMNEDGVVSLEEVEASAKEAGSSTPKGMLKMLARIDLDSDGSISYAEFMKAASHAGHHAAIHEHREASQLEKSDQDPLVAVDVAPDGEVPPVTCGGHTAPTCSECPTTDDKGKTVMDHGAEWCNGDCVYHLNQCHSTGTVTVDGVEKTVDEVEKTTSSIPDLLNPEITDKDKEIIDKSAREAVNEQEREKDTKEKEEEAGTRDDFDWGKLWLIVIITFAGILGLCAIVSVVALFVFVFMNKPELPPTKEELLADALQDEADGGEEVEEVGGEDENYS